MWATTGSALHDDQRSCLDVRTMILAGGSANLVSWANYTDEVQTDQDLRVRLQGVLSIIMHTVNAHVRGLAGEQPSYSVKDVVQADLDQGPLAERLFQDLTVQGLQLLRWLAFDPADPTLFDCDDIPGLPAICSTGCTEWTTREYVNFELVGPVLSHGATDHGILGVGWWEPPGKVTPGPTETQSNLVIASLMEASPVYHATATSTRRVLHLMSTGDINNRPDAATLLFDKLTALGVKSLNAPPIAADAMGAACTHDDYFDPARPTCGWLHVTAELTTAMPPPMEE
jgi:hypothetical protein